jgi:hypothetical protein
VRDACASACERLKVRALLLGSGSHRRARGLAAAGRGAEHDHAVAGPLKAIHAGEDIVAAREKAIRVIEKLRALRLT